MVLVENLWQALITTLETRSYRYFDEGETLEESEKRLFLSLQKQVLANKVKKNGKPAAMRFSQEKKDYLIQMIGERIETNESDPHGDIDPEYTAELKEIHTILTGEEY